MASFAGFPRDALEFLEDLRDNNNRDWFATHKPRFEQSVQLPALELIAALKQPLEKVAPMLGVEAKKMGGSLMRIYKDTRFSADKTPYKTNIGIQFRHLAGKDVHAPGVYLHIDPSECFLGAGAWCPDSATLHQFRSAVAENGPRWKKVAHQGKFATHFELYNDRLKTVPRGFDKQHPWIEDLRLKSFIGSCPLDRTLIEGKDLVPEVIRLVKSAGPFMSFLCEAMGQPY